jgi:hypothetical protein
MKNHLNNLTEGEIGKTFVKWGNTDEKILNGVVSVKKKSN